MEGLTPWQPGQSGNPEGRKTAGAYIKEWINSFYHQDLNESSLRAIARDPTIGIRRRTAAERILRAIEVGDLATFAPILDGTKTLFELRQAGINTEVVKKLKYGEHGPEIELYDRSGEDFDRICDQTEGKPQQAVKVINDNSPRTDADRKAVADSIVTDILDALGRKSAPAGEVTGPAPAPAGQ